MSRVKAVITAVVVALSPAAHALDGMSFEYGHSDSSNANVNLYRVSAQWDWNRKLIEMGNWHLGGYWETSFGYWDNNSFGKTHDGIFEFGVTPVLRFQQSNISSLSPYAELGIGFHLLSHTSVSTQRQFGSAFQFGDHVGAGVRFGDKGKYDIGYRYQHLSNAGIKQPNQGISFHQLRLQYHF